MARKSKPVWQVGDRIDHLLGIERELRALLDQRLKPWGLTFAQLSLLRFIKEPKDWQDEPLSGPIRPADVAHHFRFTPRTVTEALNRLTPYIAKSIHPKDKRSVCLGLTSKGDAAIANTRAAIERTNQDVFGDLYRRHDETLWFALPAIRNRIKTARELDGPQVMGVARKGCR